MLGLASAVNLGAKVESIKKKQSWKLEMFKLVSDVDLAVGNGG